MTTGKPKQRSKQRLVVCVKGKPRRVSGRTLGVPGTLEVSITTRGGHKQVEVARVDTHPPSGVSLPAVEPSALAARSLDRPPSKQ